MSLRFTLFIIAFSIAIVAAAPNREKRAAAVASVPTSTAKPVTGTPVFPFFDLFVGPNGLKIAGFDLSSWLNIVIGSMGPLTASSPVPVTTTPATKAPTKKP